MTNFLSEYMDLVRHKITLVINAKYNKAGICINHCQ